MDPDKLRNVKSILPFTLHKFSKYKRIVMHDYTRLEQIESKYVINYKNKLINHK